MNAQEILPSPGSNSPLSFHICEDSGSNELWIVKQIKFNSLPESYSAERVGEQEASV
jgi:hypothetical protein